MTAKHRQAHCQFFIISDICRCRTMPHYAITWTCHCSVQPLLNCLNGKARWCRYAASLEAGEAATGCSSGWPKRFFKALTVHQGMQHLQYSMQHQQFTCRSQRYRHALSQGAEPRRGRHTAARTAGSSVLQSPYNIVHHGMQHIASTASHHLRFTCRSRWFWRAQSLGAGPQTRPPCGCSIGCSSTPWRR